MTVEETMKTKSDPGRLPPGPGGSFLKAFSGMKEFTTIEGMLASHEKYGDIAYNQLGPIRNCLLLGREYVYRVLVAKEKDCIKGMGYDGVRVMVGAGLLTLERDQGTRARSLVSAVFTQL